MDHHNNVGLVLLTIHTEPNTTDDSPLPAPGTSAIWKYNAIYRLHENHARLIFEGAPKFIPVPLLSC
jgi:hypothetical protein